MRRYLALLVLIAALTDLALAQDKPRLVLRDGHSDAILAIAPINHGLEAVTVSADGTVKLWDLVEGQVLRTSVERTAQGHADTDPYEAACLIPDQDLAAAMDGRGRVRTWNYRTGKLVSKFSLDHGADGLSTDGENYFIHTSGSLIKTDREGRVLAEIDLDDRDTEAFGLQGPFCIVKDDSELLVLDTDGLKELHRIPVSREFSANISPDGKTIVVGFDQTFQVIDSATGQVQETIAWTQGGGHNTTAEYYRPEWSDDGRLFLRRLKGYDGGEILERTEAGLKKVWSDPKPGWACPTALAVGRGVARLVGSVNGTFSLTKEDGETVYFHQASAQNVSFTLSRDGRYFFAGSLDGTVRSWDLTTGREARKFEGLDNFISQLDISPDGKKLAAAADSTGKLLIWNVDSGEVVTSVQKSPGEAKKVGTLKFLDDERIIVTRADARLAILSTTTGEVVDTRPGDGGLAVVSPSGKRVFSKTGDKQYSEWSVSNKRDVIATEGTYWIDAAYTPDETSIYLLSYDGGLYKWDLSDAETEPVALGNIGKHPRHLRVHDGGLDILARKDLYRYSLDGKFQYEKELTAEDPISVSLLGDDLLVVRLQGLLSFCDAKTGDLRGDFCQLSGIDGWVAMTPDGRFDGNEAGFEKLGMAFNGEVFELEQFFQEYYSPGLLSTIFPHAKASQAVTRQVAELTPQSLKQPPEVKIVSPQSGEQIESDTFEVKVRVTSAGAGVSRVSLFHNGHRLPDAARQTLTDDTYLFTVKAMRGLNDIKATAFDGSGTVEARRERIRLRAPEIASSPPRLHVLSIGVDNYESGLALNFAVEDAKSVGELFNSGLYVPGRRTTLTDAQATREGILSALESIATEAEPQDAFVVYLAGHGTVVGDTYLFLPHDADIVSDESLARSSLSSELLAQKLCAVPATKQLLILDSCRSGAAAQALSRHLAARSGLEEIRSQQLLARTTGTFLIAATKGEDYAYEVKELGHGVLTYSILDSLGLTPRSDKGAVTANGLLRQVSERVPELSEKYHGVRQQVVQYSSGQDFPLSK